MAIQSREELKQYCLRELGAPVIKINADDSQLEDRIDDAFQLYSEYHFNATEKVYLVHTVTADDITNNSISLPDGVMDIIRVVPVGHGSRFNFMDARYHTLRDAALGAWYSLDMTDYSMKNQYLGLINDQLGTIYDNIEYVKHAQKLKMFVDWEEVFVPGESIIVLEASVIVDPSLNSGVYNDRWLKKYTTQLFKKQWGQNLKKMNGVQLIGGVTLNGDEIYSEAVQEIENLELQLKEEYQLPPGFFWG